MSFRKLAAAVCVVGLMGAVAPTAAAYEGKDLDNATIINAQHRYNDGDVINVVADGLEPNTTYLVGQCTWQTYTTAWFAQVPGCLDGYVSARTDASGHLDAELAVQSVGNNAHAGIPGSGQPPQLTFTNTHAEVLIVKDHGKGFRGSQAADSYETFVVSE